MAISRKAARATKAKARAKFDTLAGMNKLIDAGEPGVLKAKKALSNSWDKRRSTNVAGFYDPRKARASHA